MFNIFLKSPIYPGVGDLNFENPGDPRGGGFKVLKTPGAPGVGDLKFWNPRGPPGWGICFFEPPIKH